jgi:hypothetical protein
MLFLADFNREINVKAYTRIIGGKAVPVRGAKRTVMRLKEALEDLRKVTSDTNLEHAYNINPKTGIVGNRIKGKERWVNVTSNYFIGKGGLKPLPTRHTLHSHPYNTSLSWQDFVANSSSGNEQKQIFAISSSGSVYRGKLNREVSSRSVKNHFKKIESYFDSTIGEKLVKSKHPLANINNLLDDDKYIETLEFLITHSQNLFLKNKGIIEYKFKLSPSDKALSNLFAPEIDAIVKNTNKQTKTRL